MAKIYYEKDAKLKPLKNKTIAIIGYGAQGHAQAQNLRDSGLNVIVAELKGTPGWQKAKKDKMELMSAREAVKKADVIQILTQDHVQAKLYKEDIAPYLDEGNALVFSHGFNIHYGQIIPPSNIDVFMVAPKGPGTLVRKMYEEGKGVPSLVAIYQDYTKKALSLALGYANGIGSARAGIIETTFKEETETDLFGEQCVLCGGITQLIFSGFETLVNAGYQPEVAYFECCHEVKLIVDLIYEGGIKNMRKAVSDTAKYGDVTRGKRVIDEFSREEMKKILQEVQTGEFAKEWILENQTNRPVFNALLKKDEEHLIEKVGEKLRKMMPWIKNK
jgi:ketol-acid reductoisomerase